MEIVDLLLVDFLKMSLVRLMSRSLFNRQQMPVLVGLCVGIALSLIVTPILEEDCPSYKVFPFSKVVFGNSDDFDGLLKTEEAARLPREEDDPNDYEPRINLAGKPQSAKKEPQTLIRPRYFSTELNIKDKSFVAVLSSIRQVSSSGVAINETLAPHVNHLAFFVDVSQSTKLDFKTLPIVGFKDSQQNLLVLHTLKYLSDKLLLSHNFFFLIRDTSAVNGRKLAKFIDHISIAENVYMGSPVSNPTSSPTVCSLDSGVLISSSVLSAIAPLLETCTEDYAFNSEEEKIGLCIFRALNLTCQTHLQGQHFITIQLDWHINNVQQLEDSWKTKSELEDAITVYPMRDASYFYMLNKLFCTFYLKHIEQSVSELEKSIIHLAPRTPSGAASVTWPIGQPPPSKPDNRFDVLRWEYFNTTHVFLDWEQTVVRPLVGVFLEDIVEVMQQSVDKVLKEKPNLSYVRLVNGYKRFDPTRGMDYILDLMFQDKGSNEKTIIRLDSCRPITHVDTVPMPYVTESSRVHIVLPLSEAGDVAAGERFIKNMAKNLIAKGDDTRLTVVLIYRHAEKANVTDIFARIKDLVKGQQDSNSAKDRATMNVISLYVAHVDGFASDVAAADAVSQKLSADSLVMICHPHSVIHADFLNRVRINTISGWQLFSPIPFAEYNPDVVAGGKRVEELNITTNLGFYDVHHIFQISFYMADYLNARKTFELELPWLKTGKEWTGEIKCPYESILSMFAHLSPLHILRAVEPQLHLLYHERQCETESCRQSFLSSQGTRTQLAKQILDQTRNNRAPVDSAFVKPSVTN